MNLSNHPYHLVSISPWPILMSFSIMFTFIGFIKWFYLQNYYLLIISMMLMMLIKFQWWRDMTRESTFQGCHTFSVNNNLRLGMILFISSELFFFISLFWTYFHYSLAPSIEIGMMWPPTGIKMFNPYDIPLLNSIILISSGMTISWSHYSMILNKFKKSLYSLIQTIILGFIFSIFQYIEYIEAPFTISDSCFGSIFFLTTGFHGIHVLIGNIFLSICLIRLYLNHFSKNHHFGFEAAIWYWHFVDIVWLFVYTWIYWWSF
uniref:Cytochrome c oxidase subunit 3 n=2 Tax=Anterhynchium TaxID=329989 RepID=A0A6M9AUK7_9HYME|nr:cytochrome c oxidase subunit III [Anterhynchium aff. flavomarginatum HB]QKK69277.1 cytochrome c oxidase subunit III [Anterhynchium aff. flavomarginatum SC]